MHTIGSSSALGTRAVVSAAYISGREFYKQPTLLPSVVNAKLFYPQSWIKSIMSSLIMIRHKSHGPKIQ